MRYTEESINLVKENAQIIEVVGDFLKLTKHGANMVTCCPFHNEKSPSFTLSASKNIAKCFGCGRSTDAIQFLIESQSMTYIQAIEHLAAKYKITLDEESDSKTYTKPVWKNNTTIPGNVVKWFESRKISQKTIGEFKVTTGLEDMPVKEAPNGWAPVNTIQFNYFLEGELKNIKYRSPTKGFKLFKGAELIFFNIDSIKGATECIVVEGELDTMAVHQAGYTAVVSVPNGASKSNNLKYLDNCIHLFSHIKKIHIGVDNDNVGRILREELAQRFGKERCDYIEWKDKKDANDILIAEDIQGVIDCCSKPIDFPLEGSFTISDMNTEIDDMYDNGLEKGVSIRLKDFSVRFVKKYMTILTGIPSHGKSELLDEITERLGLYHNWKGAFFSPENKPSKLHFSKKACRLVGKDWEGENRMTKEELNECKKYLEKKVWFLKPPQGFTLTSILDSVKQLQERYGLDYFCIDAWNTLEHKGKGDTDYINTALLEIAAFCEFNNLHCFLVAHPTKMEKDKKTGKYLVPTLYNINGSANFYNRADVGISVYRDFDKDETQVYIQKVKFKQWGWVGMTTYKYDKPSGRYFTEAYPDNRNWITGAINKLPQKELFVAVEGVVIRAPNDNTDDAF